MNLEIINPSTVVYTGSDVTLIQFPGIEGSFEVMENHAPMISVLKKGKIKVIVKNEKPLWFDVNGGVVEVLQNKVLVLAE